MQDHWELVHWHIDLPLASGGSAASAAAAPNIQLEFAVSGGGASAGADAPPQPGVSLRTDVSGLKLLLHELKQARDAMRAATDN
jgi:hypothetical protein